MKIAILRCGGPLEFLVLIAYMQMFINNDDSLLNAVL